MVYYFSGALVDANWPQAFAIESSGDSLLATNRPPAQAAAAEVRAYTGYTIKRPFGRSSMQEELNRAVISFIGASAHRIGIEFESAPAGLARSFEVPLQDLTPALTELRRRKDSDELQCMRATIALAEAGYAAIRDRLEPGMSEFQAYDIVHQAIVDAAETSVDVNGDFACGVRAINGGGAPTGRLAQRGDLYIFDLFPKYEGYACDLCRTFCVGPPSAEQQEAWEHVYAAHRIAAPLIAPGKRATDVYRAIREHLNRHEPTRDSFHHHAGHGVGMEGWEQPWLNAGGDQMFVEGEIIACEPGLYSQSLHGGIRLEHNYLVTADGPVALDTFPMQLTAVR